MLTSQFTNFAQSNLAAGVFEFNLNTSDMLKFKKLSATRKAQISANESKLEQDIAVMEQYGPGTFQSTFAGILCVRALYKYTNEKRAAKSSFSRMKRMFTPVGFLWRPDIRLK